MSISVLNTDADLTGKTLVTAENAYTISGLHTFSRNPAAPFAVTAGSALVSNLIVDAATGVGGSGVVPAARLGTGTASLLSVLAGNNTFRKGINFASATGNTNFSTTSATYVDVTGMTVTFTTSGGSLLVIGTVPAGVSGGITASLAVVLDAGAANLASIVTSATTEVTPILLILSSPAAGSHTVKLQAKSDGVQTLSLSMLAVLNGIWAVIEVGL